MTQSVYSKTEVFSNVIRFHDQGSGLGGGGGGVSNNHKKKKQRPRYIVSAFYPVFPFCCSNFTINVNSIRLGDKHHQLFCKEYC